MIKKTIDFVFSDIIESDMKILDDNNLSISDKIITYFHNIPDVYNIGAIIRHREDLERYYPKLWEKVNNNLNTIWDGVIQVVETGIKTNELEAINTVILRLILNETLKKLLDYDFMVQNQVSFESGIKTLNDITLFGKMKRENN